MLIVILKDAVEFNVEFTRKFNYNNDKILER